MRKHLQLELRRFHQRERHQRQAIQLMLADCSVVHWQWLCCRDLRVIEIAFEKFSFAKKDFNAESKLLVQLIIIHHVVEEERGHHLHSGCHLYRA